MLFPPSSSLPSPKLAPCTSLMIHLPVPALRYPTFAQASPLPGITSLPIFIFTCQWPAHPVIPSSRTPLAVPPVRVVFPSAACQYCLCCSKYYSVLCIQATPYILFIPHFSVSIYRIFLSSSPAFDALGWGAFFFFFKSLHTSEKRVLHIEGLERGVLRCFWEAPRNNGKELGSAVTQSYG